MHGKPNYSGCNLQKSRTTKKGKKKGIQMLENEIHQQARLVYKPKLNQPYDI